MPAYPLIVVRQAERSPIYVEVRERIELGRDCDGILLADPLVSRRHVALAPQDGKIVAEDLGSTNGTLLDGNLLRKTSAVLEPGATLQLGSTTVSVVPRVAADRSTQSVDEPAGARQTTVQRGGVGDPVRPAAARVGSETSIEAVAREVSGRVPPIVSHQHHDGTITIVFSDIASSTERAVAVGDILWIQMLREHNDIIRKALRRWGGSEVKNQGDGFMLTFPGARRALLCMAEVQQEFARHAEADPDRAIHIRVGVHTGEVMVEDGDIFGKHVMVASRIANLAMGGEILASSLVAEITSASGDLRFGEPRKASLKGIDEDWTVRSLLWETVTATP